MAKLVKMTGEVVPQIIDTYKDEETNIYLRATININVVKLSNGTYEWDGLVLPDHAVNNIHNVNDELKYSVLIAHIIKSYYNDNEMTAILNNYLLDSSDEKYTKEFNQMQKIRKIAKETAKEIVENKLF